MKFALKRSATAAPVTETKSIQLGAGENGELAFNFTTDDTQQAQAAPRTTVVIHVPADAKVFLSGHEMTATGPVRQFSTTRLGAGEEWNGYTIRATIERDGQLVTKEQTISLRGGDAQDVRVRLRQERAGREHPLVSSCAGPKPA